VAQLQERRLSARAAVLPTDVPRPNGAWAPPHWDSASGRTYDGRGFIDGGVTFQLAFYDVRAHMERARPLERAPDGGPALRPLSMHTVNRAGYAWRVLAAMVMLVLDVAASMLSDTLHWQDAGLGDNERTDLIAAIIFFVVALLARVSFTAAFVLVVISTAHFRLGRYAELWTDVGGALIATFVSFVVVTSLRILRIVMAATGAADATGSPQTTVAAQSFWTRVPFGGMYSTLWVFHLVSTTAFYVKGLSAIRRLAASEYHAHPEVLRPRPRGTGVELSMDR
jgi:hypothetical protein